MNRDYISNAAQIEELRKILPGCLDSLYKNNIYSYYTAWILTNVVNILKEGPQEDRVTLMNYHYQICCKVAHKWQPSCL